MGRWGYNLSGAIILLLTGRCPSCSYLEIAVDVFQATLAPKYQLPGHEWKTNQWQFRQTSRWTRAKHLLRGILLNKQGAGQRTQTFGQNAVISHQPELKGTFQKPHTMALNFILSQPFQSRPCRVPCSASWYTDLHPDHNKKKYGILKTSGHNIQPMISHHNITYISPPTHPNQKNTTKPINPTPFGSKIPILPSPPPTPAGHPQRSNFHHFQFEGFSR